jgi:hypothetical protein
MVVYSPAHHHPVGPVELLLAVLEGFKAPIQLQRQLGAIAF